MVGEPILIWRIEFRILCNTSAHVSILLPTAYVKSQSSANNAFDFSEKDFPAFRGFHHLCCMTTGVRSTRLFARHALVIYQALYQLYSISYQAYTGTIIVIDA